ncbi:hypothetical protein CTEN210_16302 [Chaetoceros tenuissimus]|uniref:Potassium channel tetramerisation-type BTB domain-containing protein n=1 Tax=Chaetoceros tenuissimus TaxID=426638 RepID=A0AAD3DAT0_9STRA|nr:hypothetical protein CTEN210_16302 [Chaetoceros tenuissimus]
MTDDGNALEETLSQSLMKRERDLIKTVSDLPNKKKKVKTQIKNTSGHKKPSDVVCLNIGGRRLEVLRRTLCSVKGSLLASKFSGKLDKSLDKDRHGNFFIEEEFDLFKKMIDALRKKATSTKKYPYKAPQGNEDFYRMLEYYKMTQGIYPLKLDELYCPTDEGCAYTFMTGVEYELKTKKFCTFRITRNGHNRTVKSFEIRIGKLERLQIGIKNPPDSYHPFISGKKLELPQYSQNMGVGDLEHTFALDTRKSCILDGGKAIKNIQNIEFKEGTVIRIEPCSYEQKWYVDGNLIASEKDQEGEVTVIPQKSSLCHNGLIELSIQGNVKIINVEYKD